MAQWRMHLSRLGLIGLLGVGIVGMADSVAAEDISPVSIDEAVLVTDESDAAGAPGAISLGQHAITRPLLPRIPRWVKERARSDPRVSAADALPMAEDSGARTADVVTTFVGLDRPGAANNGSSFFPPDTNVAKSPTRVVEVVNSAIRLFNTAGGVTATANLNTFFGAPVADLPDDLLFDPKVYFDRNAANQRFYVVALRKNPGATDAAHISEIRLAVSRSPGPPDLLPANWCSYTINGRRDVGTSMSSWADYPGLGAGADKLVITANQFTFTSSTFTFAIVRVLDKLTLANNAAACPPSPTVSTFQPASTSGDFSIFTLQPVQHYTSPSSCTGAASAVYLINNVLNTTTAQFNYRVWRVATNATPATILQGPVTLAGAFGYTIPPDAPQAGSASLLDTGDARVTQAAGTSDLIEGVHGTGCNIGGGANESCIRYVRFSVGCTSAGGLSAGGAGGGLSAAFSQQFTFGGGAGVFFFQPGTARNISGQSGLAFHSSSAGSDLSSWWAVKPADGTPNMASSFTTGTCAQTLSNRTGDYIGAHTDPSDFMNFCFAGERATKIGGTCQWKTQITCVKPGSDVVILSPER